MAKYDEILGESNVICVKKIYEDRGLENICLCLACKAERGKKEADE